MIYHDLSDEEIRSTGLLTPADTAWQVMSAAILESESEFPDTTLVEVRLRTRFALCLADISRSVRRDSSFRTLTAPTSHPNSTRRTRVRS